MKDRFIKLLVEELQDMVVTSGQVIKHIKEGMIDKGEKLIPMNRLLGCIKSLDNCIEEEERHLTPKTKFLYVEDGSVDVDELQNSLNSTNPEIKVVVYRQGNTPPVLMDMED